MTEQNIRPEDDNPTTFATDVEAEAHRMAAASPAEQPAEAESHEAGADPEAVPETEAHRMAAANPAEQPAE